MPIPAISYKLTYRLILARFAGVFGLSLKTVNGVLLENVYISKNWRKKKLISTREISILWKVSIPRNTTVIKPLQSGREQTGQHRWHQKYSKALKFDPWPRQWPIEQFRCHISPNLSSLLDMNRLRWHFGSFYMGIFRYFWYLIILFEQKWVILNDKKR